MQSPVAAALFLLIIAIMGVDSDTPVGASTNQLTYRRAAEAS